MEIAARIGRQLGIQTIHKLDEPLPQFKHPGWHDNFRDQATEKSFVFYKGGVQGEGKEKKFDLSCVNESLVVNVARSSDESVGVSKETHLERKNFSEEDILVSLVLIL